MSNPDKPELTIEYSFENIQSFEDSENIPIKLFTTKHTKNNSKEPKLFPKLRSEKVAPERQQARR